jgi:spore germination protein KC
LVEKSNENVLLSEEVIAKIERSLTENGSIIYRKLIRKTQQKSSDIFGFGEYVRAKEPAYWNREIHTKEKWGEVYKEINVNLQVTSSIRRVGSKSS